MPQSKSVQSSQSGANKTLKPASQLHKRKSSEVLQSKTTKLKINGPRTPDEVQVVGTPAKKSAEKGRSSKRSINKPLRYQNDETVKTPRRNDSGASASLAPRKERTTKDFATKEMEYIEFSLSASEQPPLVPELSEEEEQNVLNTVDELMSHLQNSMDQTNAHSSPLISVPPPTAEELVAWRRGRVQGRIPSPPSMPNTLLQNTAQDALELTQKQISPPPSTARRAEASQRQRLESLSSSPSRESTPPPEVKFELQIRAWYDKEEALNDTKFVTINGSPRNNFSLYSLNERVKKAAGMKAKERGGGLFLLSVNATVISAKITLRDRASSDLTEEITFSKVEARLIPRKADKNLGVIMEYKYSPYEGGIVPAEIRIQQEVGAATVSQADGSKKKKGGAPIGTATTQLNREADIRQELRDPFDDRVDVLMKKYRCPKPTHCNGNHCWLHPELNRHIPVFKGEFVYWQKAIDSQDGIASEDTPPRTIRSEMLKRDKERHKGKGKDKIKQEEDVNIQSMQNMGFMSVMGVNMMRQMKKDEKTEEKRLRRIKKRRFQQKYPGAEVPEELLDSSDEYEYFAVAPRPKVVSLAPLARASSPDTLRSSPIRYDGSEEEVKQYVDWMIAQQPARKRDFFAAGDFFIDSGMSLEQIHKVNRKYSAKEDIVEHVMAWKNLGLPKPAVGPQMDGRVRDFQRQRCQQRPLLSSRRQGSAPINGLEENLRDIDFDETQDYTQAKAKATDESSVFSDDDDLSIIGLSKETEP